MELRMYLSNELKIIIKYLYLYIQAKNYILNNKII